MIILSALFAFIAFVAGYAEYLLGWEVRNDFEAACVLTILVSAILAIVFLCCGIARHTGKKPEKKETEGTAAVATLDEIVQKLIVNVEKLSPQQCLDLLNAIMERSVRECLMEQMMVQTADAADPALDVSNGRMEELP